MTRPLFDRLPELRDLVPFMELADGLPTPLEHLQDRLWVKRDDATSSHYGGNKVRKLEFLLPVAARRRGPVLTGGAVGSHHALATALFARRLGLDVEIVRFPQMPTADVVATRDRVEALDRVRFHDVSHPWLLPLRLARRRTELTSQRATVIPPAGTTPVSVLGLVNAGLELAADLAHAGIDPPDDVVVALGSGGTTVGLALGLAMAGVDSRVVGVRVTDRVAANEAVLGALATATAGLLGSAGWRPRAARFAIEGRFAGNGYGHPTPESSAAARRASRFGFEVEPTYTAKALSAALARAAEGRRVVYVHTNPS